MDESTGVAGGPGGPENLGKGWVRILHHQRPQRVHRKKLSNNPTVLRSQSLRKGRPLGHGGFSL